jgi:hypothetical protein
LADAEDIVVIGHFSLTIPALETMSND